MCLSLKLRQKLIQWVIHKMKEELGHIENRSTSGRGNEKGKWRMKRLKFIMDVSENRAGVMSQ